MSATGPTTLLSALLARISARRKAAAGGDYAVLVGLVAVVVLGAVVLTGERTRSLFVASKDLVGDGVAGLPLLPALGRRRQRRLAPASRRPRVLVRQRRLLAAPRLAPPRPGPSS